MLTIICQVRGVDGLAITAFLINLQLKKSVSVELKSLACTDLEYDLYIISLLKFTDVSLSSHFLT